MASPGVHMKLKLKSNYFELWHSAFDADGIEFRLMNNEGPSRTQMFQLFKEKGIPHVFFGKYNDFVKNNYSKERKVVIYDNINSHFGEDKRLLKFSELENEDKSKYLAEYVENSPNLFTFHKGKSTRILCVGDSCFMYDYFSYDDWRSNNGNVFITEPLRFPLPKYRKNIPYAMFAIDFVGELHELRAIDFNISPGIPTSLNKYMSSTMMVLSIKEWLQKYINNDG